MKREIAELRETIVKLTQLLANKKLKVTQMGADAWVRADPRTGEPVHVNLPNVPDSADQALITAIQGFLDHEVAHILFTDWTIKTTDPQLHNLHNMLEDTFIERKMGELFPGARSNIKNTGSFFLQRITIPQLQKVAGKEREEFSWLLVPAIRALSGQSVFQDFMDDGNWWSHPFIAELVSRLPDDVKKRIPVIASSKEGLEIARVFDAIINPKTPHPPLKAPPPPKPSEDEQDDKSGDGQGQGKKEHEDDSDQASSPEPVEGDKGEAEKSETDGDSEGSAASDQDEGGDEGQESGEDADQGEDDDHGADDDDDGSSSVSDQQSDEDEGSSEDEDHEDGNASDPAGEDEEAQPDEDRGSENGSDEDDHGEDQPQEVEGDDDAGESGSDGEGEDDGEDDGEDGDNGLSGADEGKQDKDENGDSSEGSAGGSSAGDGASDEDDDEGEGETQTLDESKPEELDQGSQTMSTPEQSEDDSDSSSKGSCFSPEEKVDASGLDLSAAVVAVIAKSALEALLSAPYTVFSRDFDNIEVIEPDSDYRDSWLPQLEEETRQMVGKMQKDVERMMASQSRVLRVGMQRKGRLNAPALHRIMAGDDRVFMHKEEHRSKETAVSLLIDNSGSMTGIKYTTAMVAAYALASTLDRVNIANEAIGFTTAWSLDFPQAAREAHASAKRKGITFSREVPIHMPIFKEFDERLNPTVRKRFAFGAYAQPGRGANVDGESLEIAAQRLLKRRERRKVMIVLSDGAPAGGHGVHIPQHLRSTVEDLTKKGIDLVGIGIMDSNVKRYYPNSVVLNNVSDLPGQVMTELKRILA